MITVTHCQAIQGASALTQLLSNVQIHDHARARACNSRSFCTYKTASHLHIPQLLKVPQFQCLAPKPSLTLFVCADTQIGEGGPPLRSSSAQPLTASTVFSVVYTLPICNLRIFSGLRTPGLGGVPSRISAADGRGNSFFSLQCISYLPVRKGTYVSV